MIYPVNSRVAATRDLDYPDKTIHSGAKGTVKAHAHLPNDSLEYYRVSWDGDTERLADQDDLQAA